MDGQTFATHSIIPKYCSLEKKVLRSLLIIILLALAYGIYYAAQILVIVTGFDAKQVCNCVFVAGRDTKSVDTSEMGEYPYDLAKYTVNFNDSTITASALGFIKRKAIYRKGVGCTLISNIKEEELRAQFFSIPQPPEQSDTLLWPYGDKTDDNIPSNINKEKLEAAVNDAFKEPYAGKKQRTRAVIVLYDGKLLAEQYAPGFDKNTKMYGWSMAKSFTSALVGTLVKANKLDINQPASVPEWSNVKDTRHNITTKNLLQQSSGLDFVEKYSGVSDATKMLCNEKDMAAYTANRPLKEAPGSTFYYSSGNSNILARIIRQTVGEKDYAAYPFTALFYKINMYNTLFEPDPSGTYVGSSYINATARDYARFGLLYYNDGVWNGERILPEGWVQQTVTPAPAAKLKNYGYQFWLNGLDESNTTKRVFPDVPADMFYCDGYAYQFIFIIPSKKMVVVRLGLTLDHSFDENNFLKSIIEATE